jgi:MGT family glycosyltransferase
MSKVLYLNGDAYGHINPSLALVDELIKNGEEIFYTTTKKHKENLENIGCKIIDIDEIELFKKSFDYTLKHPLYKLIESIIELDDFLVPILLKKTKNLKFDYILHDSILGPSNIISKKLNIPGICISTTFVLTKDSFIEKMMIKGVHPELNLLEKRLKTYEKKYNIGKIDVMDLFFKKENLNIVFTSKEFHPKSDNLDNTYKFIGPSIGKRNKNINFKSEYFNNNRKTIYISMGTINNDLVDFYNLCIETFKNSNLNIILSIGFKVDKTKLLKIPDNFIIKENVPQLEILQYVDGFISHGGQNSVSESIINEVPMVIIPRINDQFIVGNRIKELDLGILIYIKELNNTILKSSIFNILNNKLYKENCKKINSSFKKSGGIKKAIDYIFDFKKSNNI